MGEVKRRKMGEVLSDNAIKGMLQDIASRKLVRYLEKSPFIEFRIAKQSDEHYIVHPIGKDGETLDMKWIITDDIRNEESLFWDEES